MKHGEALRSSGGSTSWGTRWRSPCSSFQSTNEMTKECTKIILLEQPCIVCSNDRKLCCGFCHVQYLLIEIETNLVKSEPMPWKHQSFHKPHFSNRSTSKWVVPSCSFCWDGTGCPVTSLNFFRRRITSSTRTIQQLAANSTHQHSNISSYGLSYGSHVIHIARYWNQNEPKWTKYTKYILPETWHIFWHHLTSHPVTLSRLLVSAEAKADSMASSKDGMKLFAPVASGFLSPLASDVRSRCLQNCTAPLLPSDVPLDGHLTMRAFIMALWCFDGLCM